MRMPFYDIRLSLNNIVLEFLRKNKADRNARSECAKTKKHMRIP